MSFLVAVTVGLGLLLVFEGLTAPRRSDRRSRPLVHAPALLTATVGAGASYLLTGWPTLAVVGAVVGLALPRVLSQHRRFRRRLDVTQALADAAAALRDAVRGGLGLSDGLAGLAAYGPPLLRDEFATFAAESGRMGIAAASARFAARVEDAGADLLAATLAFNDRVGGKQVTQVLDAIAEELAEEARTLRELRARQARQRTSARVVALAPLVLLLILRQVNPEYLEAYSGRMGQLVLAAASALIGIGYLLMIRIARVVEPPRIAIGHLR